MVKRKVKHIEPPAMNMALFKKEMALSELTYEEREEVADRGRLNQRNGPSEEVIYLKTGRKIRIYGTRKVELV